MKLFTVKDFIAYNNPCFVCGDKIIFTLTVHKREGELITKHWAKSLNPLVTSAHTILNLKIAYFKTLEVSIEHSTNKIKINNIKDLKDYLINNALMMSSVCSKCGTEIHSTSLELSSDQTRFKAVKIRDEFLQIKHKNYDYVVFTNNDKSTFAILNKNTGSYTSFDAPALYLYKIKTKEKLIEKLKLYLTFS